MSERKWVVECAMTGQMWGPFETLSEAGELALKLNQPLIRTIQQAHKSLDTR
jgi:hypothetical protein